MAAILVLTTVGTEQEANQLAEELLERRLGACVNIVSGVRSVYRWKGQICKDSEYLLVIKTEEGEYDAVAATIGELHSYELPEILALPVQQGSGGFLSWISECVDKTVVHEDDDEADESE
jgi:periplasmic divalent cation tolerance protein